MKKEFTFEEKRHRYFLDGKPLTGVTTILGVIAKPALVPWAAKMVTTYISENCKTDDDGNYLVSQEELMEAKSAHRKKKEAAGDFGTVVHNQIEAYVKASLEDNEGRPLPHFDFDLADTGLEPDKVVRVAEVLEQFKGWAIESVSVFLESEARLYSEKHWYAGTTDILYKDLEGKIWLADIKTSGAVYPEYYAQMGGYDIAYNEMNGDTVDIHGYLVIRLDKERGGMELVGFHDTKLCREFFLHALGLYRIVNNLKV